MKIILFVLTAFFFFSSFTQDDPLAKYISHIKEAYQKGSSETSMGTVGYDMVYGIQYFESRKYDNASWYFETAIRTDQAHPYAHYLYGLCLLAMGQDAKGKEYLDKAISFMPELKGRLANDMVAYSKKPVSKVVDKTKPVVDKETQTAKKDDKPAKAKNGGALVYGNYTCDYMQYQGAGAVPAFRPVYKGYFKLNADGTYRWLDNGAIGKYKYDAATGKITWLSGYFATAKPIATTYAPGDRVACIDIEMVKNYVWSCGCNKK